MKPKFSNILFIVSLFLFSCGTKKALQNANQQIQILTDSLSHVHKSLDELTSSHLQATEFNLRRITLLNQLTELNQKWDNSKTLSPDTWAKLEDVSGLSRKLDSANELIKNLSATTTNAENWTFLTKQIGYYSAVASDANLQLSQNTFPNSVKHAETFASLGNELKNLNYYLANSSFTRDSRVDITVKVYDSLGKEAPGWTVTSTSLFITSDSVVLGRTNSAAGKVNAGDKIFFLRKGAKIFYSKKTIDATDKRTWAIEIHLDDL